MPKKNAAFHRSQRIPSAGTISAGQIAFWPGGTTPLPNFLLDTVMPTLSDTQWRLLCVIARQTLGWQAEEGDSGQRKQRDWLTHAQLKARTGRASAALCGAIDELVRRRLIEVQDAQGTPLATPQERRRAHSQLFYRLYSEGSPVDNLRPHSLPAQDISQSETVISQSEFRKAKTTKENETKEILKKNSLLFAESEKHGSFGEKDTRTVPMPAIPPAMPTIQEATIELQKTPSGQMESGEVEDLEVNVQSFIARYQELYRLKRGPQAVPPIGAAERDLLRQRLKQHPAEYLERWLPVFFSCTFGYVRRRNYSLESFLDSLHILQAAQKSPHFITDRVMTAPAKKANEHEGGEEKAAES